MKIEVYALTNNEEQIMPYFMRHYTQFAHVILLENNSTDRTVEIAQSMGAEIWKYDVPDEINDQWYLDVKNNCWKNSKADWVIIGDADEFVYHPHIIEYLERTDATIFLPRLWNMFSEKFPTTTGQIYEEVTGGRPGGPKMNLFRPSEIKEINYDSSSNCIFYSGHYCFFPRRKRNSWYVDGNRKNTFICLSRSRRNLFCRINRDRKQTKTALR